LVTHLAALKRQSVITDWHDRKIGVGTEFAREIDAHLKEARLILLLVSPDFIASDYCYNIEVSRAMEKHEGGDAIVIPVILKPCDWEKTSFGSLQALPTNAKPVAMWDNEDSAFLDITNGIREAVDRIARHDGADRSTKTIIHKPIPDDTGVGKRPSLTWGRLLVLVVVLGLAFVIGAFLLGLPRTWGNHGLSPRLSCAPTQAQIQVTLMPDYDPVGGTPSSTHIAGEISGSYPENCSVVIYSHTDAWYVQPTEAEWLTPIEAGKWSRSNIHAGSEYAVLLVVPSFELNNKISDLPTVGDKVLAKCVASFEK